MCYLYFVSKNLQGLKVSLVEDPKPRLEPDVKVVDILKIPWYLFWKIFRELVLAVCAMYSVLVLLMWYHKL